MKFHSKLAAAAVFGLMCAGPFALQPASAQMMAMAGGMGGHEAMGSMGMHGSPFLMLLRSANLSAEQRAQVQQILQSDQGQMHTLHQQFEKLHEQIAEKLLGTGRVSDADMKPLVAQASQLQQQMDANMIETAVAIRNILTPEQVAKLAQVHKQLQSLHSQIQSLMGPEADSMGGPAN